MTMLTQGLGDILNPDYFPDMTYAQEVEEFQRNHFSNRVRSHMSTLLLVLNSCRILREILLFYITRYLTLLTQNSDYTLLLAPSTTYYSLLTGHFRRSEVQIRFALP